MSRKKQTYYAVANGKPLAFYGAGVFGRNGFLCRAVDRLEQAALYIGYSQKRALMRAIERTLAKQQELRTSVVFDWEAARPLIELGVVTIAIKKNDGPSSRPVPEASVCPGQSGMAPASLC